MPESTPWDDDAAIPLPPPAAVAIVLELARTRGLERLRSRFRRLCAAASLQAPPLHAVERWLLLSKWEETIARPSTKPAADPLFPCEAPGDVATAKEKKKKKKEKKKNGTRELASSSSEPPGEERAPVSGTADAALADDLERAGLPLGAATRLVAALRRHSVALAEGLCRLAGCLDRLPAAQTERPPPIHSAPADDAGTTLKLSLRPAEMEVGWQHIAFSKDGMSKRRVLEAAAAAVDEAEAVAEAGAQGEDEAEDARAEMSAELSAEVSVLVTSAVVDKLRVLYARHLHRRSDATSSASSSSTAAGPAAVVDARLTAATFDARLFCCLLRYQSIGGAGFQAGLGGVVFRELQASLGCCFEGFASPLNTYYGAHCSAYADVDAPFGSRGSFAAFEPSCGSLQLNPPFVPAIIDAMAERVIALLSAAQRAGAPLAFTIVLPGWTDCVGYQRLGGDADAADAADAAHAAHAADAADAAVAVAAAAVDAAVADAAADADVNVHANGRHPFLRASLLLAAADHGFVDGAAHRRPRTHRESPYDTRLFVLQTDAAAAEWPATAPVMARIRLAFAACTPSDEELRHVAPSERVHRGGGARKQRRRKMKRAGQKTKEWSKEWRMRHGV
jgi:phosphorylated CTD-interacting factor 1